MRTPSATAAGARVDVFQLLEFVKRSRRHLPRGSIQASLLKRDGNAGPGDRALVGDRMSVARALAASGFSLAISPARVARIGPTRGHRPRPIRSRSLRSG